MQNRLLISLRLFHRFRRALRVNDLSTEVHGFGISQSQSFLAKRANTPIDYVVRALAYTWLLPGPGLNRSLWRSGPRWF